MTTTEKLARIRFYIDEKSEKNFTNTDLIVSLNAGQDKVQDEIIKFDVGFFEKPADLNPAGNPPGTIAGVYLYVLPADFKSFKLVERTDTGEFLRPLQTLAEKVTTGTNNIVTRAESPYKYKRVGKNMLINPTPQSAFPVRLWYVYRVPQHTLADGSFVSELPLEWHEMVCIAAAIDARIRDEADTADLERLWGREYTRLQSSISSWQSQEPKMVVRSEDEYY